MSLLAMAARRVLRHFGDATATFAIERASQSRAANGRLKVTYAPSTESIRGAALVLANAQVVIAYSQRQVSVSHHLYVPLTEPRLHLRDRVTDPAGAHYYVVDQRDPLPELPTWAAYMVDQREDVL